MNITVVVDNTVPINLMGQLWMKQSSGKCLFLMGVKRDSKGRDLSQQINTIINLQ